MKRINSTDTRWKVPPMGSIVRRKSDGTQWRIIERLPDPEGYFPDDIRVRRLLRRHDNER